MAADLPVPTGQPGPSEQDYLDAAAVWLAARHEAFGVWPWNGSYLNQASYFRAAVDSAFAASRRAYAEIVGPCMDESPRFGGCTPMHCELPAGHAGAHTFLTSSWTRSADWRAGHAAGYDEGRDDGEGGAYTAYAHPGRSTDDA